jgi:hypothetical protein
MFKALIKQRTSAGERKPGDEMPEMLTASPRAIKFAVDAGHIEWSGKGGKYGSADVSGVKAAVVADSRAKAPVARAEFDALAAEVAELRAILQSEGSAPIAKPAPSKAR